MGKIQDRATTAALMALNRAVDAMCESDAGARNSISARLLRAYADQTENVTKAIVERAHVLPAERQRRSPPFPTPPHREAEPS